MATAKFPATYAECGDGVECELSWNYDKYERSYLSVNRNALLVVQMNDSRICNCRSFLRIDLAAREIEAAGTIILVPIQNGFKHGSGL